MYVRCFLLLFLQAGGNLHGIGIQVCIYDGLDVISEYGTGHLTVLVLRFALEQVLQCLRVFLVCNGSVVELSQADYCRAAALVAPGYLTVGESSPEVAKDVISFHVVDHLLGRL